MTGKKPTMSAAEKAREKLRRRQQEEQQKAATTTAATATAQKTNTTAAVPLRVDPIRITVDLSPVAYSNLRTWCADTASALAQPKVPQAAVLRALIAELTGPTADSEALADRVRTRLVDDLR